MKKKFFRPIGIGGKIALTIVIPICLFIFSTFTVNTLMSIVKQDINTVDGRGTLSIDITELATSFSAKYTQIAEYVILNRQQKVNYYGVLSRDFQNSLADVEQKLVSEEQKALFDKIKANNDRMDELFQNKMIPAMKQNNKNEAIKLMEEASGLRSVTTENTNKLKELLKNERTVAVNDAKTHMQNSSLVLLASTLLSILLAGIAAYLIGRSIQRNIRRVVGISQQIAQGNLEVEQIEIKSKDEIGQLNQSINLMSGNLRQLVEQIQLVSRQINAQSHELARNSYELKTGSEQISATMDQLALGTEEQAGSASEIANMIEELNQRVMEASEEGNQLKSYSEQVLSDTEQGRQQMIVTGEQMKLINQIMLRSVSKVKQLEEKAQEIFGLVEVIREIAEQTNLLALNAAIESARAGEAGRGFSVVAEEVRKLADRTQESVKKISSISVGIQTETSEVVSSLQAGYQEVEQGSKKMEETGQIFSNIYRSFTNMAENIKNSSERLQVIEAKSKDINRLIEQIASVSEEIAAGVEETAASAQQQNSSVEFIDKSVQLLGQLSSDLQSTSSKFKLTDDRS
ncbi:methyl-accepting chemotaxis protein [Brevibacillus massiliensis]|uniref:methyl-accepting chemotaxis protein n=1 Tax=Brevibacillus massiliensis TaxID=1118054 RepID=UPI0002D3ACFB|nr:HAMP domain-containing methyl-accepting chemotaxis protein [Brevibacillus massiliensis]